MKSCGLRPHVNMADSGRKLAFRDYKNVVSFAHNQLWRPLAAKVKGPHSGLPKNGQLNKRVFNSQFEYSDENYYQLLCFL